VLNILSSDNLKNTITVKPEFHCDFIEWHPSGALLLAINQKGDVQVMSYPLTNSAINILTENLLTSTLK